MGNSNLVRRLVTLAPFVALVSSVSPTLAQTESPTEGLALPDASVVTTDDATALEVNPAGLGFMRTVELGYGFQFPTEDLRLVANQGQGVFLAGGTGLLAGGVAVQWLERPEFGRDLTDFRKYTLGTALSGGSFSFGLGFNWFGSSTSERLDNLFSLDVGSQWRVSEHIGVGLMVRDANAPFLRPDESIPALFELGVGLRFLEGRVVFTTSAATDVRDNFFRFTPRLTLEPLDGLRLFGRTDLTVARRAEVFDTSWDGMLAGLELSLSSIGAAMAATFDRHDLDDSPSFSGVSSYYWISPRKQRGLVEIGERWIYVDLNAEIREGKALGLFVPQRQSFLELVTKLDRLARDETVSGVVFTGGSSDLGYAQAWEIRRLIRRIGDAGKKTITLISDSSLREYYLASASEEIWLLPTDVFHPGGLRSRMLNVQRTLEAIGIEAQFVRIGEYKTAPEMFVYQQPTREAIEERTEFIDAFYHELLSSMASARGKEIAQVREMVEAAPLFPTEAHEQGYVDALVYQDEAEEELRSRFGSGVSLDQQYGPVVTREERWGYAPEIAVVVVEGNIIKGTSGETPFIGEVVAGSDSLTQILDALRRDANVKAVVVRIDSPGGSALASDLIYRQMRRLAKEKPVIASMGNIAASGGYYVAAGADEIFAAPTTITGSIGIYAGKFNVARLADMIGVNRTAIERGKPMRYVDIFEPWNEGDIEDLGKALNYLYRLFLTQVANTRPLTIEEVDAVGRGRVWVGARAQEVKLVDQMGGLMDAIARAEELAGLEHGEARYELYPRPTPLLGIDPEEQGRVAQWLGLQEERAQLPASSVIATFLREAGRALLVPLLYAPGEAVMMPLEWVEFE